MLRDAVAVAILLCAMSEPPAVAAPPAAVPAAPPASPSGPEPDFLRRLVETRSFTLGRPVAATPTPDGKSVLFLRSEARVAEQSLYEMDVATGQARALLTPAEVLKGAAEQLSPAERARRERMRVATRGFSSFELSDDGAEILLALSGRLYVVRRADRRVSEVPTGEEPILDPRLSPDGRHVAFVRGRDLYALDRASGRETRLTRSTDPHTTNGVAEFVAQEELGRFTGYWWSPDGRELAFEEADTRGVETLHVGDLAHPEAPPEGTAYPRAGRANATVRVGVVPVDGGKPRWVGWDHERFPYLASATWRRGGPLTLVVLSRDQRDLEVLAADPLTGHTRRLVAEHDDAWIDLDPTTPRWLDDGSGFLWSTEREGVRRLELRDRTGVLVRALDLGGAEVVSLVDVDTARRLAHVTATAEPSEEHLYRVPLDGGPATPLTPTPGMHVARFGKGHGVYVLSSSTLEHAPRTTVRVVAEHGADRDAGALPSVAEEPPFVPTTEIVRLGERELRVAITRPRSFDARAGRRYPVIVDVYAGPHHLSVTRSMLPQLMRQWLADHGYVVIAADGRGTPHRGRAFGRALRGDFAGVTLDDQVAALRAAAARHPEMDLGRVGISGWSFGGYMAALAVMKRPDVFHVAVAGAPVVDWRDYDTAYTERYLGLPDAHPEAYRASSLLTYAASLARPLLLIHGTGDDNVYFLHTLKLADALFRAGRRFELLPLSGFTHMVPDPLVRERLQARILDHLSSVLKP